MRQTRHEGIPLTKFRINRCVPQPLSLICFGSALVTGRMHFFATPDCACETITVFLEIVMGSKGMTPPDSSMQEFVVPVASGEYRRS